MAIWFAIRRAASIAVPLTDRGRVPAISKRFYSPKEMSVYEIALESISKLKEKNRGRPPRTMRSAPLQSKIDDESIITEDYLLQDLPPGSKVDFEGIRKVLYKIRHPFEDPYLQLPRWAIYDDDYGDDDQDDFNRMLDVNFSDFDDDEEEDEPQTHQS